METTNTTTGGSKDTANNKKTKQTNNYMCLSTSAMFIVLCNQNIDVQAPAKYLLSLSTELIL